MQWSWPKLSRRAFVASAATFGILAACRPARDPAERGSAAERSVGAVAPPVGDAAAPHTGTMPGTTSTAALTVWIETGLAERFAASGARFLQQLEQTSGSTATPVADPATAGIRIGREAADGAVPLDRLTLVLVTSPRLDVHEITGDAYDRLLRGEITDWERLDAPVPAPVTWYRLAPLGSSAAQPNGAVAPTVDALAARFAEDSGAVALLPLDLVDARFNVVGVDDIDPLEAPNGSGSYPLTDTLYVWSDSATGETAQRLATTFGTTPDVPEIVTVNVAGDVILGRTVHTIMTRLGDYAAPFYRVADTLAAADLTIADLECSLSDVIEPPDDPYTFAFMTRTAAAEGLALAGIDAVSRANNHSMNFGAEGMRDTGAALESVGIRGFGIGETLREAREPAVFTVRGLRLAFLGYDGITGSTDGATDETPGTAPLDTELLAEDIAAARRVADIVIPFVHWGVEYTLTPTAEQRSIAYRAVDAGAAAVIGSHPHWVQGMEVYHGVPILYSLANFVFDQEWSEETKQGIIARLVFHGTRLAGIRLTPILIEDYFQPGIADAASRPVILDRFWTSTDEIADTAAPAPVT